MKFWVRSNFIIYITYVILTNTILKPIKIFRVYTQHHIWKLKYPFLIVQNYESKGGDEKVASGALLR
jgi:hypothetical protein